jgi:hypothetical protein
MVKSICGGAKDFTFPCYDPLGTKAAIQQQIKLEPGLNVVVAGLNTKASTLGVGLAGIHNQRVQLCYAQAVIYTWIERFWRDYHGESSRNRPVNTGESVL